MIERDNLDKLCQSQTHVLKKRFLDWQRRLYIIFLFLLSFFLLIPLFFYHKKQHKIIPSDADNSKNFHAALAANLVRLHQLQNMQLKKMFPIEINQHHLNTMNQVRQHAPTRAYTIEEHHIIHQKTPLTPTLLDRSNDASFVNQSLQAPRVMANRLVHPTDTVPQGELIQAVLETAINSELPGMIRAVVARPVYSYLGNRLLIPAGSRLIGQYSSQILQGMRRIMVIWQRILLPDGVSIQINSPGSDTLGQSGLRVDAVNTHFFQRFSNASLLSLIGAASANWNVGSNESDNASQRYRTALSHSFQSSAGRALNHDFSIKPTLHVNQGSQITVFVARDLDFYSTEKLK